MTSAIIIFGLTLIFSYFSIKSDRFIFIFSHCNRLCLRFWTYFTYTFVHLNFNHAFINSIFFIICFPFIIEEFSNNGFLIYYFGFSMLVSISHSIINRKKQQYMIITGNSGILLSLATIYVYYNRFNMIDLFFFEAKLYVIALIFFFTYFIGAITDKKDSDVKHFEHFGHFAGILYGFLYAYF